MKKLALIPVLLLVLTMLTACGSKVKSADLSAVMNGFTFETEMTSLDEADLDDYYGIDMADVKQYAGSIADSGIDCEEVVLIEAVDAKAAERVRSALETRYQAKLDEADGYLPDEYAIIKKCGVRVSGNYVAMIVAPNEADLTRAYEASFK